MERETRDWNGTRRHQPSAMDRPHTESDFNNGEGDSSMIWLTTCKHRLGENNSKWSNWQRINLKNIQATPAAQFQKNKWPNQKMGQRTKQKFLQRRHTDG